MDMKFVIVLCLPLVVLSSAQQSPCQLEREEAQKDGSDAEVVPECEENGEYSAKQCKRNGGACQCWRRDGTPINDMSPKIKACTCVRHRDDANSRHLIGNYKPQCEDDGTYRLYQCWGSVGGCWCVDKDGRRLTHKQSPIDC